MDRIRLFLAVMVLLLLPISVSAENVMWGNPFNETMMDTFVLSSFGGNNYDGQTIDIRNLSGNRGNGLLMFAANFSTADITIQEAYLVWATDNGANDGIHSVHGMNATFDETTVTWNTHPCGGGKDNLAASDSCNETPEDFITGVGTGNPLNVNRTWNVTDFVRIRDEQGASNISFIVTAADNVLISWTDLGGGNYNHFHPSSHHHSNP